MKQRDDPCQPAVRRDDAALRQSRSDGDGIGYGSMPFAGQRRDGRDASPVQMAGGAVGGRDWDLFTGNRAEGESRCPSSNP